MPELARIHRGVSRAAPFVAFAALVVVLPALHALGAIDAGVLNTWGKYCCYAIMAVGLDLVWGYGGMLSLCQMLFFALGGYCLGMYLAMHGPQANGVPECISYVSSDVAGFSLPWFWRPFTSFAFAAAAMLGVPALVAFVFGWFAFRSRVRGVYLSIMTQALTIAFNQMFILNQMRLGGTNGLTKWRHVFGCDLWEPRVKAGVYLCTALTLAATVLLATWLTRSRCGRILIAVRDNESRLRFAGYQPTAYKTLVFALGAALAGLGGALFTLQNGMVAPSFMEAKESIVAVVMVALGGRGTVYGAVVGALLYQFLQNELTTLLANGWLFVLGGLFVVVVVFLPDGLVGAWRALGERLRAQASARRVADDGKPEAVAT